MASTAKIGFYVENCEKIIVQKGKNWVSCCQEAATLAVTTAIKAKIYCLYPSWQGFGRLWTTTQSLVTMINLKDLFNHLNEDSNVFYFFYF